jgi:hypothetical protein
MGDTARFGGSKLSFDPEDHAPEGVSEFTNSDERIVEPSRMLTEEERILLDCYRSGQIEEWAWTEHLAEHPGLSAFLQRSR